MTDDAPEKKPTHVERHARQQKPQISPYELRVKFRPELKKQLEVVSSRIDPAHVENHGLLRNLLSELKELGSGNVNLLRGMELMGKISLEIGLYCDERDNRYAEMAWQSFVNSVGAYSYKREFPAFMLEQKQKARD